MTDREKRLEELLLQWIIATPNDPKNPLWGLRNASCNTMKLGYDEKDALKRWEEEICRPLTQSYLMKW